MFYHFGECELDDSLYQLRRGGKPVDIEPKVFDVLVYLLRHRDRLIAKEELLDNSGPAKWSVKQH
jgi:DNA-binding winged helix-turn-helix (wHTH) protein